MHCESFRNGQDHQINIIFFTKSEKRRQKIAKIRGKTKELEDIVETCRQAVLAIFIQDVSYKFISSKFKAAKR